MTMRTAIIGLGVTGTSCVRYLHDTDELSVVDTRVDPPGLALIRLEFPDVALSLGARQHDFTDVDRIVVSPGVSLQNCLLRALPESVSLISDVDLFCEAATAPIIAVTGTNGKSTVTALVGHLLNEAGITAFAGGNLGEPALELLDESAQAYVLELSSFQLERMQQHRFEAATVLNLSEDHLDRHGNMDDYLAAKQRILRDCAVVVANRGDRRTYPLHTAHRLVTFGEDEPSAGDWGIHIEAGRRYIARGPAEGGVIACDELPVAGRHNELNVQAAFALASSCGVSDKQLRSGIVSFRGLRHRCERIATVDGVTYIDDSKATNVGATLAALEGLGDSEIPSSLLLIAGGDGKGADFSTLRNAVSRYVGTLVLFGQDADDLERVLADSADVRRVANMHEAVALCACLAQPGDCVLLSPACASLDMYENFAARGADFVHCVESLSR